MTRRPGFALVLSLLVTLALMVLALGVLAVGTRETAVAAAVVQMARAERQSEAAVSDAVRTWSTRAWVDLPTGRQRLLAASSDSRTTVIRVDQTLFMVRAEAWVPGPWDDVVATAAVLIRTLPPVPPALPGAINAAAAVAVDGGTVSVAGPAASCDAGDPGPGIVAPMVTVAANATVVGTPPVRRELPPPTPAPDPLAPPHAARIAQLRPTGHATTPRPLAAAGHCVANRKNWGSPDPGHPCHGLRPVVYAEGPFTVAGGEARAVLVVNGDLRITSGAVLEGMVIVHGHLRIDGGSVVRGAVRARSVRVTGGTVLRDDCAIGAASEAPALDRAYRPPTRWWVPAY